MFYDKQSENHAKDRLTLTPLEQMFAAGCAGETRVNMADLFYPDYSKRSPVLPDWYGKSVIRITKYVL